MLTDEDIRRHNAYYQQAWDLLERVVRRNSVESAMPRLLVRPRLEKAKRLLERALQINEAGWQSMWALGKIHQRLGEDQRALDWFLRARDLQPRNADVLREGSIAAMALGDGRLAASLSAEALQENPNDPGLLSNHALALLLTGDLNEASEVVRRAVQLDPENSVSRRAHELVSEVASGKRPPPKQIRG